MIKAILFDADGVLIQQPEKFSARFSREYNLPADKLQKFFDGDFRLAMTGDADLLALLERHAPEWGWEKSVEDLVYDWFAGENYLNIELVDDIVKLRENGIPCYLVSNQEKYRAAYISEEMGVGELMDDAFFSCDIGYAKPSPEFWQYVKDQFPDLQPEEILVWDDHERTVESARDFGFKAELYTDFPAYQETMKKYLK